MGSVEGLKCCFHLLRSVLLDRELVAQSSQRSFQCARSWHAGRPRSPYRRGGAVSLGVSICCGRRGSFSWLDSFAAGSRSNTVCILVSVTTL